MAKKGNKKNTEKKVKKEMKEEEKTVAPIQQEKKEEWEGDNSHLPFFAV